MNSKAALQNNKDSKAEEEEKNKVVEPLKLTYPNGLAAGPAKDKSNKNLNNQNVEESFSSFGGAKLGLKNKDTLTLMEKRSLMKQGTHFGKPPDMGSNEESPTKVSKDVEIVETLNTNRKISDEEIKNAAVLLLEELTGEVLKNNKLKINAAGLTTGLRKTKDGVAFFGKVKIIIILTLISI